MRLPLRHALPALPITAAPLAARADGPTRLHVVRHAETVANQTGKYTKETLNVLSERGEEQRRQLTQRLLGAPKFDAIVVSSVPRAAVRRASQGPSPRSSAAAPRSRSSSRP